MTVVVVTFKPKDTITSRVCKGVGLYIDFSIVFIIEAKGKPYTLTPYIE